MSSKMIGMDVGTTAVRVVEIAGVGPDGFAVITRIGIAALPEGAVVGGRIRSPERVAYAMKRALRESGIPRYGIVLGMATPDVSMAKMLLPASVRREERLGAVTALGRPISPTLGLSDSALTTSLVEISQTTEGTPMATIDVVATRQSDLDALLEAARMARIVPRAVDLTGAALLRSLTRANASFGEVGTVVDIGATKVTVATRQGARLRSLRTTQGGGAQAQHAPHISREHQTDRRLRRRRRRVPTSRVTGAGRPQQCVRHARGIDRAVHRSRLGQPWLLHPGRDHVRGDHTAARSQGPPPGPRRRTGGHRTPVGGRRANPSQRGVLRRRTT